MNAALYATIGAALVLFVIGEWGKQTVSASPPGAPEITEGETFLQFSR